MESVASKMGEVAEADDHTESWAGELPRVPHTEGRPALRLTYFGLLLFTLVYFVRPSDWVPGLGTFPIAKVTGLVPIVLLAGAVLAGYKLRMNRELWLLIALFIQLLLCIPFSIWRGGSFATVLFGFSKAVVLALIGIQVLNTATRIRRMIFVQTAAVVLVAALSLYEGVSIGGRMSGALHGIFENPNDLAGCITVVLPFALLFMLLARNAIKKLVWLGVIVLLVWAVVGTYSRGGFLSMIAVTLAIAWFFGYKGGHKKLFAAIVLVICLLPVTFFVSGSYSTRVKSIFDFSLDQTGSADARRGLFTTSLELTLKHPFFGIGPGQFAVVSGNWHVAHNSFTEMGAEAGIPGFVLFLWLLARTFNQLRKSRPPTTPSYRELGLLRMAALSSMIAFAVSACFASYEYEFYPYILIACCCGVSNLAMNAQDGEEKSPTAKARFEEVALCAE